MMHRKTQTEQNWKYEEKKTKQSQKNKKRRKKHENEKKNCFCVTGAKNGLMC